MHSKKDWKYSIYQLKGRQFIFQLRIGPIDPKDNWISLFAAKPERTRSEFQPSVNCEENTKHVPMIREYSSSLKVIKDFDFLRVKRTKKELQNDPVSLISIRNVTNVKEFINTFNVIYLLEIPISIKRDLLH